MSEKQPEALRLADALEQGTYLLSVERDATAAELRRLGAENDKLREENGVLQYALTAYKDMELHLHAEQDRVEELEIQLEAVGAGGVGPLTDEQIAYAKRYAWLRSRDVDAISYGGVFAGMTPDNVVLSDVDLDAAIDAAMERAHGIRGAA